MDRPPATTPELDILSTELGSAIAENGVPAGNLTVVSRQPNVYTSTFPSEIITCQLGERKELRLLCKYSAAAGNESYGARGGVEYEADVYRELLQSLELPSPGFYGVYRDSSNRRSGLLLEYLADSVRIFHDPDPETVFVEAARWIGRFHALCSSRAFSPALSFLHKYDAEYYRGWARRTLKMAQLSGMAPNWLETVCSRFDEVIEVLCKAPATVIHGEYYPKNILVQDRMIYPVDWESTAVGCGEIDLATLTEGWTRDEIGKLELEYQRARWPQGAPDDYQRCLGAARIYIQFRWLGDRQARLPDYTTYLDALHRYAGDMGLI
jgi:hypothetical protein